MNHETRLDASGFFNSLLVLLAVGVLGWSLLRLSAFDYSFTIGHPPCAMGRNA